MVEEKGSVPSLYSVQALRASIFHPLLNHLVTLPTQSIMKRPRNGHIFAAWWLCAVVFVVVEATSTTCPEKDSKGTCTDSPWPMPIRMPRQGTTVYMDAIFINLERNNTAFFAATPGRSFCFTLYNTASRKSAESCVADLETIIYPKHLIANGIGSGKIEFSAWLKETGSNEPIADSWVSFSFQVNLDCIDRFNGAKAALQERADQIGSSQLQLQNVPFCFDIWEKKLDTLQHASTAHAQFLHSQLDVFSGSRGMFGVPFFKQSFGHGDRIFMDFIFSKHQEFKVITEFGTFSGVTSMYLGMTSRLRGMSVFNTFDMVDYRDPSVKEGWLDNMKFHLGNLEQVPLLREAMVSVIQSDFLFVDGGNKKVEAYLYAGNLRVGAGLLLHDYEYENRMEDTPKQHDLILQQMGFTVQYEKVATAFNSCARFWIRTSMSNAFDLRIWLAKIGCTSITNCDVSQRVASIIKSRNSAKRKERS